MPTHKSNEKCFLFANVGKEFISFFAVEGW